MKTMQRQVQEGQLKVEEVIKKIDSFSVVLTKLEQELLFVLLNANEPLSTRGVRGGLTIHKYRQATDDYYSESPFQKIDFGLYHKVKKMGKKGKSFMKRFPYSGDISQLERELKTKHYIQIPCHVRIDNTLKSLESLGILFRRSGEKKNAKYFWAITPTYIEQYKQRREKLIEEFVEVSKKIKDGKDEGRILRVFQQKYPDWEFYNLYETIAEFIPI